MKEYKITSADFVTPGESLEPDAIMSPEDLANIKSQSGLAGFLQLQVAQRVAQESPHENLITIVREQKFEDKGVTKL